MLAHPPTQTPPRTIEVRLPDMHPGQHAIAVCPVRHRVVSAGRRYGKTHLGVALCLQAAGRGGRAWWVAPTYKIAGVGWRMLAHAARQVPGLDVLRGENRVLTPAGGWVEVRSADGTAGLRGEGLDLLVVDEAAHIRGLQDIWEQELRPTLSDRRGRALFISTPAGYNYFYDLFRRADHDPDYAAFQRPSAGNPHLPPSEIAAARRELPELVYRQEYLAEFVQLAGAMFRREYFSLLDAAPPLVTVARHWDLAGSVKTAADYSAGVKIGLDADGYAYVLDVVRGRWEWPALVRVIGQAALADGAAVGQTVETGGTQRGMLDLLLAEPGLAGLAFRGVAPVGDKVQRANPWLARAEQGKVRLLRAAWNDAWLDEVCAFPAAEHDDMVDATSGAFAALGHSGGGIYL